ncbi:hypothetical protein FACS1894193_08630 [Bacilli bacterium]|nr:hypothetical protein FACS1894192_00280 [Bacilli bacterium]GHU42758.1 hypothetical protein FACS1894193_08630 [Bacilli bacterium]
MMKIYMIKKGTQVIENDKEIILRRGVIHKNELVINKDGSSEDFMTAFKELQEQEVFAMSAKHSAAEDFATLSKFGYFTMTKSERHKPLIIVDDTWYNDLKAYMGMATEVWRFSSFLSDKEVEILTQDKNILAISEVLENKKNTIENFDHIYLIANMASISSLRAFNRLMQLTEKINTMAFVDNENVYMTGIEHGETGCYECLEQQILTHFDGFVEDYLENASNEVSGSELLFVSSLLRKEIDNLTVYGQSSLLGNMIHFSFNNYEYSFETNRIQSCCTTCATFNHILFEEQNMRSINILKEVKNGD